MSHGEMAYLVLALSAFGVFILVIGFISIWSQARKGDRSATVAAADHGPHFSRVRFG